jgi:hypothetical protein
MLIALMVYFVGGWAYQRTVMHQRGWKQLPNYSMWSGIFGFFTVGSFSRLLLGKIRTDSSTGYVCDIDIIVCPLLAWP